MKSSKSTRMLSGAAVGAAAITAVFTTGLSPVSAGSGGSQMVAVPAGIKASAVPGAKPFGNTPASTPETVSFILTAQNLAQLETAVEHGIPSSAYLSVTQFAAQYGQTAADISRLQSYLSSYGINSTAYPDGLDVVATGRAGDFDKALSVQQQQYSAPATPAAGSRAPKAAQTFHGTSQSPMLPSNIASYVTAVLGLTNYGAAFTNTAVHAPAARTSSPSQSSSVDCTALTGLPDACHLPSDFASQYKLSPLYKSSNGSGRTVAIVTLAALDPGAPEYFWQNVAHVPTTSRTVTVDNIDGGPGAPSDASGTGETDLDVEQSGALAPGADVVVYQAPNTDTGFADAFFTAASQNVADTMSVSWGESETILAALVSAGQETPAYVAAFDEAFLEMAAQGQSTFTASGDSGAYGASSDLGTTNLSVGNPDDSPYITATGGTTVPWSGSVSGPDGTANVSVAAERAWGWDYLWQPIADVNGTSLVSQAESMVVGSGGGFSADESTPSYQQGVSGVGAFHAVEYLTPTAYQNVDGLTLPTAWNFNFSPSVTSGTGTGRAEPDLSTNADPFSGYLLYEPSFAGVGQPTLQGGWGGTSFVAPELNGSAAVIDAVAGHRVGFWNPAIYPAATGHGSPFTALQSAGRSNDNIFYTGNPGTVYNQATGLGTPNLTALESVLSPH
jgi:subtilase family serine protease